MQENYGRDLDLNLLRVFCVVAETGSVTAAAAKLYLTQPAVSAALRRLSVAVGAPLFVRRGRHLALSSRGSALKAKAQPHLAALVEAALTPEAFDPMQSTRVLRLGLSDASEMWLLPRLLRVLSEHAPDMRVVAMPVQFRNVLEALSSGGVDMAVTVADVMPPQVKRCDLFWGDFVCLFDARHAQIGRKLTERAYFEHEHVIVSYNADLRGIVEDMLQKTRKSRCSVASFSNIPAIVEGSALLATVPRLVALEAVAQRPPLRFAELPLALGGGTTELLWPSATDDDEACRFVREHVRTLARQVARAMPGNAKSRRQ
jgi:LysR family transcriptional activator of mexEF-oprN operon